MMMSQHLLSSEKHRRTNIMHGNLHNVYHNVAFSLISAYAQPLAFLPLSILVFISLLFFTFQAVDIGLAEDGGAADNHPLSAIPVLRDLIAEINRLDEEMAQMGYYALPTSLFMRFVEPDEPYDTIDESQLPVRDGSVDLTVAARIEEREFDGFSEFSVVVLLTVNGRMVDFEMDGSRSADGTCVNIRLRNL